MTTPHTGRKPFPGLFSIKDSLIYLQHTRLPDSAKAKLKWQLGAQATLD